MTFDIEDKNYITTTIRTEFKGLFKEESDKQFDRLIKHFDERFVRVEKYFDARFEQAEKHLDARFDHHVGVLRDDFNNKFAVLVEITKDKPGRDEVREIVREEARYVVRHEMKKFALA